MKQPATWILTAAMGMIFGTSYSQNDTIQKGPWTYGGMFSTTISQVGLSNWQAGGESSFSVNALFKVTADYAKDKITWRNYIEAGIGATQLGEGDIQKTDDRVELSSKLGYNLSTKWDVNAFATFRTQFTEGFEIQDDTVRTRISHFMAPAYLLAGLGFEYKPTSWFYANLSPATSKLTFVLDQTLANAGAFGVDPAEFNSAGELTAEGSQVRYEIGGYIKLEAKRELVKNVALETKADFFSNYLENPGNIDITWDLILVMKVNSFLSANLTTNLIYDDDINIAVGTDAAGNSIFGPRVQFKEVFGAGLTMKW